MNDTPLIDAIKAHLSAGGQQWHTPGHGSTPPFDGSWLDWAADLTEVGDLAPDAGRADPIFLSEAGMAQSYGVKRSWYSVQGASLAVTAAVLGAAQQRRGKTVVVERTSHRSVLSALVVGGLEPKWVYPAAMYRGAAADQLIAALSSEVAAVVLTRPTYDGLAEDIVPVIAAAHRLGIPVVVDEAHGTHWYGRRGFPVSAIALGADLVAHGAHKTEPVLTQAGILHLQGNLVSESDVALWWNILATSSPSYLLMASLDAYQALRRDQTWTERWEQLAVRVRQLWATFSNVPLLQAQYQGNISSVQVDPAKLTILGSGRQLADIIQQWGWPEKTDLGSATLILSPSRPISVVESILSTLQTMVIEPPPMQQRMPEPVSKTIPRDAMMRPGIPMMLCQAEGHVARNPLVPYPPGIPLVQPGEIISPAVVQWILEWQQAHGGLIEGVTPEPKNTGGTVWVVE